MPIAATSQSVAAVVKPRTERPCRMIAPAPRKPMPVTIWAAMRVGSYVTPLRDEKLKSVQAYAETIVNSAAPTPTRRCVRNPASRSLISRSAPIAPARMPATTRRTRTSSQLSSGSTDRLHGLPLGEPDVVDPAGREVEQVVELIARERRALGGRLHLDQPTVAGHDHVHVHLGGGILDVVEIEQALALDDANRDCRDRIRQHASKPDV